MQGYQQKRWRGRPINTGKFKGSTTKVIRVPIDKLTAIYKLIQGEDFYQIPVYGTKVPAGFPSPADDYIEKFIDLNKEFIKHPSATYGAIATGDSMIGAGIFPGTLLLVDRSIEPAHGDYVIASVNNGDFMVKQLFKKDGVIQLLSANDAYAPIQIKDNLEIWGVVAAAINSFVGNKNVSLRVS